MEIQKGTLLKVFKNERTIKKDGEDVIVSSFSTSLTKKVGDTYHYLSLGVNFAGDLNAKANKFSTDEVYTIEVEKGFISFDEWDKNGVPQRRVTIVITEAKCKEHKPVQKKESPVDDLPF